jgi:[NiFe] hydrogenase small subunit
LRSMYPWIDELVLEILSVEYHETIMAAAGHQAEDHLHNAVEKYAGKFICVVEGSVATKFNGGYGKVAGNFLEIAKEVVPKAAATVCIGSCSSFGGIPGGRTQPRRLQGRRRCAGHQNPQPARLPAQPDQPVGTIVNYLLLGKLPAWMTRDALFLPMAKPSMTVPAAGAF